MTSSLRAQFRDLDHFLRQLVASAQQSLLLISPYLSPAGLSTLQAGLAASAQRGAWIQLVTGNLAEASGWNRRAIKTLFSGVAGSKVRARCRVLVGATELPILLHAKIIAVDGERGYLGSANFSWSALEKNFELGVELGKTQTRSLVDLVTHLENTRLLVDCTRRVS